jgi:hypothetical protein
MLNTIPFRNPDEIPASYRLYVNFNPLWRSCGLRSFHPRHTIFKEQLVSLTKPGRILNLLTNLASAKWMKETKPAANRSWRRIANRLLIGRTGVLAC